MGYVPENTLLGRKVAAATHYDPDLLQGIARSHARSAAGIVQNPLPFTGEDIWNIYELSWLDVTGKPVVAMAEVRFSACAEYLIESKSFKLYLNSFHHTRLRDAVEVCARMTRDLSAVSGASVQVDINPPALNGLFVDFPGAVCIDTTQTEVTVYNLQPDLLACAAPDANRTVTQSLCSHLFRSECPVTGQPDHASVRVDYTGPDIDRASLLRYLVSFRQHRAFHEQCVEQIFTDIKRHCHAQQLTVSARFTRRGGLDINPVRTDRPDTSGVNANTRLLRQ